MTNRQKLLCEMVLGVLVYSVVLGFFNDYTDILYTRSYSTTFGVAVVLQALTYATFACKDWVVSQFKQAGKKTNAVAMAFSVWLVMFFSKFVFLAAIEVLFGQHVQISGFIGLIIVIAAMTIATSLITYLYKKLG